MFELKPQHSKKQAFREGVHYKYVYYSVEQIYKVILERAKFLLPEVEDIFIDRDGMWIYLSDKYETSDGAHTIHFYSIKELRDELHSITQTQRGK